MSTHDPAALDGNALAGQLAFLGSPDVTSLFLRCSTCGRTDVVAGVRAYVTAVGSVARCVACDAVLVVAVERPGGTLVAMPGASWVASA
jgi:hypothetical protein